MKGLKNKNNFDKISIKIWKKMHDHAIMVTMHLLSMEGADWLKLHDMFNAHDAKSWPR